MKRAGFACFYHFSAFVSDLLLGYITSWASGSTMVSQPNLGSNQRGVFMSLVQAKRCLFVQIYSADLIVNRCKTKTDARQKWDFFPRLELWHQYFKLLFNFSGRKIATLNMHFHCWLTQTCHAKWPLFFGLARSFRLEIVFRFFFNQVWIQTGYWWTLSLRTKTCHAICYTSIMI